jgi:SAM-dependent methyltransferase
MVTQSWPLWMRWLRKMCGRMRWCFTRYELENRGFDLISRVLPAASGASMPIQAHQQTAAAQSAGPPDYRVVGRHAMMPQVAHDDVARFNFLANMNRFLSTQLLPGVKTAFDRRAKPAFEKQNGRAPETRREVAQLMRHEVPYQNWSALRRATMENRQQTGRGVVLAQLPELIARAQQLSQSADNLRLDHALTVPRYIAAVEQHCMPGGYSSEVLDGDVSAAANYDVGIFATTGGGLGRFGDGGGLAVTEWLQREHPSFKPKRILDLGAGLGHNTLPLAQAFPDAQVIAIDVAAPMLRYGAARAASLGVHNVRFEQANAECLAYPDQHFDLIMSCMFLHETSFKAIQNIFAECKRLLAADGISIHLEQPQYHNMEAYEAFIRDWDAHNNNEPFWTTMHEMDLVELAQKTGFSRAQCFETGLEAVVDEAIFPKPKTKVEDYGRKAAWYAFGTTP